MHSIEPGNPPSFTLTIFTEHTAELRRFSGSRLQRAAA